MSSVFRPVVPCVILSLALCLQASFAHAEYVTLQDALVMAYQNNPSLEAERAKLRATDEQVSQALSHWRPSVDATGTVGKTYQYLPADNQFGNANFDATTGSVGVQVTQPLFRGFRTVMETEAAEKQVLMGRAHLQAAEQQLFLEVATTYLDIVRDEFIYATNRDNESALEDKVKEINARAQSGDLSQTDIQQGLARIARARVETLQSANALVTDRNAYTRLVGTEPASLQRPDLNMPQSAQPSEMVHLAETVNPNVVEAQYAVEQAKAEIDMNKGSLLPEINLVGSTSRSYGENVTLPGRFDSSQILAEATIPLYRAGTDYSKIREAQQQTVQHRMELEEARHKAIESVRNAVQIIGTMDQAIKADQTEIDTSNLALQGLTEQSRVGTRTTIDVLNGQQEVYTAKSDIARSEHDRDIAILQLKAGIGMLTADALKLPIRAYDPKQHYDDVRDEWIGFGGADDDVYKKTTSASEVNK